MYTIVPDPWLDKNSYFYRLPKTQSCSWYGEEEEVSCSWYGEEEEEVSCSWYGEEEEVVECVSSNYVLGGENPGYE